MSDKFDIHRAALEAQAGLISKYLSSIDSETARQKVNEKDADKRTPLHWSATSGKAEIARDLLDAGADLEEVDESGWTALMIASSAGSLPVVQELLQRGASPSATNLRGKTSLHYAASKGHVDIGRALLEYGGGGDINARDNSKQCPIHSAAATNKDAFIRMLINPPEPRDGSKREKTRVNPADRFSNTPLHLAMESGHGSTAVLLLEEAGADRERMNMDGQAAEDLEGLGGQAQQRVKDYINSKSGPRGG